MSFALGVVLGFLAAVLRGWTDQGLSRFNDLMMAIPTLIFALVVLSVLPTDLYVLILVMAVLDSTRVFRISRAVAVDVAVMDFVEAARLRGEGWGWIMFREILPNTLSPLSPSSACASPSPFSSSPRSPSSGSACSRRSPTGAPW